MSTSLNIGQFFGNVSNRWATDSVVVNRLIHTQARALPSHAHQAGFVSLMLEGEYRETGGFFAVWISAFLLHLPSAGCGPSR